MDGLILEAMQSLAAAPWDSEAWPGAIRQVAQAAGFWGGHLIGTDSRREPTFAIGGGLPDGVHEAWMAAGGPKAVSNPRALAIFEAREMTVLQDDDFISAAERRRHPMYQEVYAPFDVDQGCVLRIVTQDGNGAILTAVRAERAGGATPEEKRVIAALAPALAQSVRLQALMEGRATAIALGALDAVGLAALICDDRGLVRSASPAADALLARGQLLSCRGRSLQACAPSEDGKLQAALARVRGRGAGADNVSVTLLDRRGAPSRVEVVRLPGRVVGPASLAVIVHGERAPQSLEPLISLGLTGAEAEVALALRQGASPTDIARSRNRSVETVRQQLRSTYAKLGVSRQAQLVMFVRALE